MKSRVSTVKLNTALSPVLGLVILAVLAALVYVALVSKEGEGYTEFYILGSGSRAADYPGRVQAGEEAELVLGIGNHEREETSYHVELRNGGETIEKLAPVTLEHLGKCEQPVSFTLNAPPGRQTVEFLLYKEGQAEVYRSLHLCLNVAE